MNRKNVISSVSKLPALASASAMQEDSAKGGSSMKGRHRSVANGKSLNASYAGKRGPIMSTNKIDMHNISNEVLDVRI